MATKSSTIGIRPVAETKNILEMMERNWKQRFDHIRQQMMYLSAKRVHADIETKLRGAKDDKDYRDGISVAKVTGTPTGSTSYAVAVLGKKKARNIDPTGTLIVITATRRLKRMAPEVAIMVRFNPWTVETLPFTPNKADAIVTYRKVTPREVEAVTKKRKMDQRVWQQLMTRAGARKNRDDTKEDRKALGKAKGVSDLAFAGQRLEWGQGGTKPKPHWRPAIWGLQKKGIKQMMKSREFTRTATDPGFKGWMKWPTKTKKTISVRVATTFGPFQKKLGIKTNT